MKYNLIFVVYSFIFIGIFTRFFAVFLILVLNILMINSIAEAAD